MIKSLKIYLTLLKPFKKQFRLAMLAGILAGSLGGGGIVWGAKRLFSILFQDGVSLSDQELIAIAITFPLIFLFLGCASFTNAYYLNFCGCKAVESLRLKLFQHFQHLQLSFFKQYQSGDLISKIMADCQMLQLTLSQTAKNSIIEPARFVSAFGVLIYLAIQRPGVAPVLFSVLIIPLVIFPIRSFSSKIQRKAFKQQEELGNLTSDISQNITGAKEVRAYNLQEHEITRFSTRIFDLFKAQMKVVKYSASLSPVVELMTSFGLSIAFIIGKKNGASAEDFIAIFLALYVVYSSLKKIGGISGELNRGLAAYQRIQETLDTPITLNDPQSPQSITEVKGSIEFQSVSFSYDNEIVLKDISVSIAPGDICALVGPSGAGKSTFAMLVPRFYDVEEGKISIDGYDLRDLKQYDLRGQIAVVSQEPMLFDLSVMDNIRLGKLGATDHEVKIAAKNAFAHDFIRNFPDGYKTIVGENGTRLSGGQKQRIAIARAFLKNAPILILDEATSALDSESEQKIQKALEGLVVGKTVLVIAHRFSTIRNANKILVFEDGKIIDSGPHATLYESCPLYKKLYDQQSS